MRLPARNTLLTSPLATQVSSGASFTAAAASGRVPTMPPATSTTPRRTALGRRRRERPARIRKAAARPMSSSTVLLPGKEARLPGGEEADAGIGGSGRPVPVGAVIPPAVGGAAGQGQQDQQAQAEQRRRGRRRAVVPAGEGGLRIGEGQFGSRASRDRIGNRPDTEETAETRGIEPVRVGGSDGRHIGVLVGASRGGVGAAAGAAGAAGQGASARAAAVAARVSPARG